MAVVRLSKNGNSIQFIDEEGNVFIISTSRMKLLANGVANSPYQRLLQMPFGVNPDRFPKSDMWIPPDMHEADIEALKKNKGKLKNANDALSIKAAKEKEQKKAYMDSKVW